MVSVRNGKGVVAALCLISFGPLSLGLSCAGIFYPAIAADTGLNVGLLSFYTSAIWIAALVLLPLLGKLFSRAGACGCVTGASLIIALDFIALSFTGGLAWFVGCGLVMGAGVAMLLFLAPSTLVNRWFSKRTGALLGLVMAFTGIGGAVWCAIGGAWIELWGWHVAYRLFAVVSFLLGVVPAAALVRDAPGDLSDVPAAVAAVCPLGAEGPAAAGAGDPSSAKDPMFACGSAASFDARKGALCADIVEGSVDVADRPAGTSSIAAKRRAQLRAGRHPHIPYRHHDGTMTPGAPVSRLAFGLSQRVAYLHEKVADDIASGSAGASSASGFAGSSAKVRSRSQKRRPLPNEVGVSARRALPSGLLLLIADIAFILNFDMYLYFIIPSFVRTLPAAAAFPVLGALAASAAMAGQTISKVALGFAGDRAPVAGTMAGIAVGLAGMAVLWLFPGWAPLVIVGAFLFGAYCGVANVMMPIFTRLGFGMRDYPRIYARVSMAASLGAIVSGLLWGMVIGTRGGYGELFAGVAVLLVVALGLVCVLGRRLKAHLL